MASKRRPSPASTSPASRAGIARLFRGGGRGCGGRGWSSRRRGRLALRRRRGGVGSDRGRRRWRLAGRGRGFRGLALSGAELAPLLLGEPVVFLPFLTQRLLLVGRQLLELPVALARGLALLRGEARPGLHAPLHLRLLLGLHLGIALGDAEPLALARGLELVPGRRERREDLLLLGRQLRPARRLLRRGRGGGGKPDAEPKCYCEERLSHASNPLSRYASSGRSPASTAASISSISVACCVSRHWLMATRLKMTSTMGRTTRDSTNDGPSQPPVTLSAHARNGARAFVRWRARARSRASLRRATFPGSR